MISQVYFCSVCFSQLYWASKCFLTFLKFPRFRSYLYFLFSLIQLLHFVHPCFLFQFYLLHIHLNYHHHKIIQFHPYPSFLLQNLQFFSFLQMFSFSFLWLQVLIILLLNHLHHRHLIFISLLFQAFQVPLHLLQPSND